MKLPDLDLDDGDLIIGGIWGTLATGVALSLHWGIDFSRGNIPWFMLLYQIPMFIPTFLFRLLTGFLGVYPEYREFTRMTIDSLNLDIFIQYPSSFLGLLDMGVTILVASTIIHLIRRWR